MKKIEFTLIKTPEGNSIWNENDSIVDFFDDTDEGRKAFMMAIIDGFLNQELEGGRKYK